MSKEIEHVQFVSTCRKDEKIVRHVAKNGNMSNGNIRHVEAEFDILLRHVAGVDGALVLITNRKSHTSFRLVQISVTLNDLERLNSSYILGHYTEFDSFACRLRHSVTPIMFPKYCLPVIIIRPKLTPPLQRGLSAIADLLGFYLFSLMYHIEVNTKNGYEKNDNQQLIRRHYYHKCKKTFCTCFILVTFLRILTFFLTF